MSHIVMASQLYSGMDDDWCTPQWSQRNHILRAISGTVLLISIQLHLSLRAYALHLGDRSMRWFLASLFVVQLAAAPVRIALAAHLNPDGLAQGPLCFKRVHKSDLIMAASGWLPLHFITLVITLRRFIFGLREGWGYIPFVFNGVRDDVTLFSLILVFWLVLPSIIPNNVVYLYSIHSYFLSICPLVGCRLILNSQKLKLDFPESLPISGGNRHNGNVSTVISEFDI
ncbi:hypothetical protein CPB83DRAFT_864369 [Crepidotus variabilis]|uniref:Uncharacterized protein n=1 Tax=Crepidotus variabilis TaxID=179855 RepID=A0A9P6E4U4_9AGAR|nr:hypothetical protein CPB83DRAFT_864369 [Crepidotus variabilis]